MVFICSGKRPRALQQLVEGEEGEEEEEGEEGEEGEERELKEEEVRRMKGNLIHTTNRISPHIQYLNP